METESVGLKTIVAVLALVPSIGLLITVVYMVGIFRAQIRRNTEEVVRVEAKIDSHLVSAPMVMEKLTKMEVTIDNIKEDVSEIKQEIRNGKKGA